MFGFYYTGSRHLHEHFRKLSHEYEIITFGIHITYVNAGSCPSHKRDILLSMRWVLIAVSGFNHSPSHTIICEDILARVTI